MKKEESRMSLSILAGAIGRIELSSIKLGRAMDGADFMMQIWCLYVIMLS